MHVRDELSDLVGADRADPVLCATDMLEPGLVLEAEPVGIEWYDDAALAVADIGANAFGKTLPKPDRSRHEIDFAGIPAGEPDPAPIPAGLLAGDDAFLAKHDREAAFGEFKRRRGADNASANDDGIGACGQRRRGFYVVGNGAWQGSVPSAWQRCERLDFDENVRIDGDAVPVCTVASGNTAAARQAGAGLGCKGGSKGRHPAGE
jgi:hypothetical protein